MRRYIITGAPGGGKTAIIRQLELDGFSVVEEAATDVIAAAQAHGGTAQPWTRPSFIDAVVNLQRDRQIRASYQPDEVQFHDRCAVCTAEAMRISFAETVRFEKLHEESYRDFGFELVSVEPGSLAERVSIIKEAIR